MSVISDALRQARGDRAAGGIAAIGDVPTHRDRPGVALDDRLTGITAPDAGARPGHPVSDKATAHPFREPLAIVILLIALGTLATVIVPRSFQAPSTPTRTAHRLAPAEPNPNLGPTLSAELQLPPATSIDTAVTGAVPRKAPLHPPPATSLPLLMARPVSSGMPPLRSDLTPAPAHRNDQSVRHDSPQEPDPRGETAPLAMLLPSAVSEETAELIRRFHVTGVVCSDDQTLAVVNGSVVRLGDDIDGARVIVIDRMGVILRARQRDFRLRLRNAGPIP